FVSPWREALAIWPRRVLHAGCRIGFDVASFGRPTEQAAHGVEEVARLGRRCYSSLVPAPFNVAPAYPRQRLVAGSRNHALKNVLALAARCVGQLALPRCRVAVLVYQPL